jgi:uncharacterized protein YutE (UPF0331/DUF86 family)
VTSTAIVLRKLAILREHVARARRRRQATLEEFQSNVDAQDALALSLLVALQEAGDIALHMAADEGWGVAARLWTELPAGLDALDQFVAAIAKHME